MGSPAGLAVSGGTASFSRVDASSGICINGSEEDSHKHLNDPAPPDNETSPERIRACCLECLAEHSIQNLADASRSKSSAWG